MKQFPYKPIPGHFKNGGTGITNFKPEQLPIYEAAIKEFGSESLTIENRPIHDSHPSQYYSLHTDLNLTDLSEFWRIFYRIESETPHL